TTRPARSWIAMSVTPASRSEKRNVTARLKGFGEACNPLGERIPGPSPTPTVPSAVMPAMLPKGNERVCGKAAAADPGPPVAAIAAIEPPPGWGSQLVAYPQVVSIAASPALGRLPIEVKGPPA